MPPPTCQAPPDSLYRLRVTMAHPHSVLHGRVRYAPVKSLWLLGMSSGAVIGGPLMFSWSAFALFLVSTATVLLLGHSLGSHRQLIHQSFQCTTWMKYLINNHNKQNGHTG